MCNFVNGWAGKCKHEPESEFCIKHKDLVCSSCGVQAIKSCDETMGPCVCGSPLCDMCEHTIGYEGHNGGPNPKGYTTHCKKGEQVYKPWYARENNDDKYTEYGLAHPEFYLVKEIFQCKHCGKAISFDPDNMINSFQVDGFCNVDCFLAKD